MPTGSKMEMTTSEVASLRSSCPPSLNPLVPAKIREERRRTKKEERKYNDVHVCVMSNLW